MSKKHKYKKHLEKGRFYHFHEGSKSGHPGLIFWKNDKRNLYLAITFDSSSGQHRIKLRIPIGKDVHQSYAYSRPILAKRKNVGGKRIGLKVDKSDKDLIRATSQKNHRETNAINRKDRRYLKRLQKKPKY